MDNKVEKGCDRISCPFNDGYMCTNTFGCMCYDIDFLNSKVDVFSNGDSDGNVFKNFIR